MATVLGLAMRITADASGLSKSLTPVDRALQQLGQQADKSADLFDRFKDSTTGAADAQENVQRQFAELTNSLQSGVINAEEFATQFAAIQQSARETADAFARGAAVTEQAQTAEERRAEQLAELNRLLELGAISQQTFERSAAEVSGANAAAAEAERERASAIAEASRIIQANLTPQERYDAQIVELKKHLDEGRLSQDQFNRAQARAKSGLDQSSKSAERADESLQGISRQLRLISTLEIGRALVDSFQLLTRAVRAVTTQITSVVSSVTQSLDAIDKLSIRTGVAREALQGYGVAAELAGVSVDQFGQTVQRLAVAIGRATPTAELLGGLDQLGVSLDEIRRLSPEQQFALLAERIAALPTAAQRAGAAFAVFGEQGVALAPLFEQAGDSLEGLRQRAERLGIIVSDDQIAAITEMNDTFTLVRRTVEGIIGQITANLAPVVTSIADDFLRFVEGFKDLDGRAGGSGIADVITRALADGFRSFLEVLRSVGNGLIAFGEQVAAVIEGIESRFGITRQSTAARRVQELEDQIYALENSMDVVTRTFIGATQEQQEQELRDLQQALRLARERATAEGAEAVANQLRAGLNQGIDAVQDSLADATADLAERLSPQFQLTTNVEETREAFDNLFEGLVDQSSEVTVLMRGFEQALAAAREDGELTADEIETLARLQEQVNAAIRNELQIRQAVKEETKRLAEEEAKRLAADQKRIASLLDVSDAASRVEEDILAVRREQERLAGSLAAGEGDTAAQQQRLAELEQLEARLEDQLLAAQLGFDQGFQEAFDGVNDDLDGLIEKAIDFGGEGAAAAQRLQDGIANAQQQARDGVFDRETFEAEVQRQQQLFEGELERIQQAEDFRRQLQDEALAAEEERREAILEAQKAAQEEQEQIAEAAAERQRQIFAEQRKAAEAEAKRQEQRIRALNTLGAQTIQSGDIRTAEGAALVQRLAAEAQDPALIEQRRQTRLLQQISAGIAGAAANYFDSPVEIVGFARIGGIP